MQAQDRAPGIKLLPANTRHSVQRRWRRAGLLDFALHLDEHLGRIIAEQGARRAYALLAAIVFCETGLVRRLPLRACDNQMRAQPESDLPPSTA